MPVMTLVISRVFALLVGGSLSLLLETLGQKDSLPEKFGGAVFGEAAGGSIADLLKEGTATAYEKILQQFSQLDKDHFNHDLQRAARKAQLLATGFAVAACLKEIDDADKEEKKWLNALGKSLEKKINNLPNEVPQTVVTEKDISQLFDAQASNPVELRQSVVRKLQEETFDLIRTDDDSFPHYSMNGFELLKAKIENGWTETASPTSPSHEYKWFELVCGCFNEEYKNNPAVKAAMQKNLQLDTLSTLNLLIKNLDQFGDSFERLFESQTKIQQTATRTENKLDFFVTNLFMQFRQEEFALHERTHEKLDKLLLEKQASALPQTVFNLPNLTETVYDRVAETHEILRALCGDGEEYKDKFWLLAAPSGFGKTFLLTRVLQSVIAGNEVKPEYREKVQGIIRFDCRITRSLATIVSDFSSILGSQLNYAPQPEQTPDAWLNKNLFAALRQVGTIWIVLENFEAWLDAELGYAVTDKEIRYFLNALFEGNHSLRGLLISQSEPEAEIKRRLKKLETVGDELYKGLPEEDALKYLQTEGAEVGLDRADENLLKEFLRRVYYIPQALNSLIGYLKSIEGYTFEEFIADEELWQGFDEYESESDEQNLGKRRTKALVAKQIAAQSEEVKLLLRALAFFGKPTPREALELLFEKKAKAATVISRLETHRLAIVQTDLSGTRRYELHAYFREQTRLVLPPFTKSVSDNYAAKLYEKGQQAYRETMFRAAIDLYECSAKVYRYLADEGGRENFKNSSFLNAFRRSHFGFAWASLGNLLQQTESVEKIKREQSKVLISVHTNKREALESLGNLAEAVVEHDKAIEIFKELLKEQRHYEQYDLAKDLVIAYKNKANGLIALGRLDEAQSEFDNAVEVIAQYKLWIPLENAASVVTLLPKQNREKVYAAAGDFGEKIRQYVEAQDLKED